MNPTSVNCIRRKNASTTPILGTSFANVPGICGEMHSFQQPRVSRSDNNVEIVNSVLSEYGWRAKNLWISEQHPELIALGK